jgi:ABC-type Fe3+/spermidine/putrescine transport system ATPase subunit
VYQNVAFGLEMRKISKNDIKQRVADILAKVQLSGLEQRYPRQLSGGQQQRTALARALVINPSVLLLDEPLANLDAKLREEMRFYIRTLQQEFGITTVYVTHDQAEALVLADRVAVMRDGVLQQIGPPDEIYQRPENSWVADFVGLTNLIPGTVGERSNGAYAVETGIGTLWGKAGHDPGTGSEVLLSIRPESLRLRGAEGDASLASTPAGPHATMNRLNGVVRERAYLGNLIDYRIDVDSRVVMRVQAAPVPAYRIGDPVSLSFSDAEAWLVRDEGRAPDGDGRPERPIE